MHFKILKMIATDGFLTAPNSFSAGALPWTSLRRLQRSPDPLAGLKGPYF